MQRIYKHIGPGERVALAKLAVEHLERQGRPLRIAVDISIWQFQIQSGQGGKNPALRTLYYRLLRLLALSIQPLFIFDGPHKPPFKRGKKTASGAACLPDFLTKELLKRFGFPYHTAPGEAEAECALFQKQGVVDAVLSEDVDTMMFGCSLSLRNWTAEGVRGNKSPSHVNVYRAGTTKENAGLDSEGMILVALMSGGDYIPAGVPGCGPKTACEAAKAGFGRELCEIPIGDDARLVEWRERLGHELRTNERKLFRQRHRAMKIPESFPDMTVLGYYMRPAVSSIERVEKLRDEIRWSSEVNVPELRLFVADAFNWSFLPGAKKFIRGLAPALLIHQLNTRNASPERDEDTLEANESAEALLVKAVCDRRSHWNTDGMPELRIAYIPNEIVRVDLDVEEEEDVQTSSASGDEQQGLEGDLDARDHTQSPSKKCGASIYDPNQVEKIWILETFAKLGVPVLVETWEEEMRDAKKFASRKARVKKTLSQPKAGTKEGAMDGYVKLTKPISARIPVKDNATKQIPGDQQPDHTSTSTTVGSYSSPGRRALSENRRLLGQKTQVETEKTVRQRKPRTKSRPRAQISPPSLKDTTTNPWTLSQRPPDTLHFRSPTRYSALGIYPPDDFESSDRPQTSSTLAQDNQSDLISPPASPSSRKRHSRPITPVSVTESKPSASAAQHSGISTPSRNSIWFSTPKARNHTELSARKRRSPLEECNELYQSGQLITPTSKRRETLLDKYVTSGQETPIAKNVNRKLISSNPGAQSDIGANAPASNPSTLPSPSALVSPRMLDQINDDDADFSDDPMAALEAPDSPSHVGRRRRLIALRESLEGAWKHLEPWEGRMEMAKGVYGGVEVVDLTTGG